MYLEICLARNDVSHLKAVVVGVEPRLVGLFDVGVQPQCELRVIGVTQIDPVLHMHRLA